MPVIFTAIFLSSTNIVEKVTFRITPGLDQIQNFYNNAIGQNQLPKITTENNPKIPPKVIEASKKKLRIGVEFFDSSSLKNLMLSRTNGGTGFCISDSNGDKIFLMAKHIIFDGVMRTEPLPDSTVNVSPSGVIFFGTYTYKVYAFYNNRVYNLSQIGIGKANTEQDFLAFRIIGEDKEIPTFRFQQNSTLGEEVYMDGFSLIKSMRNREIIIDIIDTPFEGKLNAVIENIPFNKSRLEKLYRITGKAEPGFSGGPVYNKDGEVMGMTTATSSMLNFVYATSAKDLQQFVSSLSKKN